MNAAFDLYTLVFMVIAVVIFLRLRSVLGKRTGFERPPFDPYSASDSADSKDENVITLPNRKDKLRETVLTESDKEERIKAVAKPETPLAHALLAFMDKDKNFDPRSFLQGAKAAYEMIVTSFAKGDKQTLGPLLAKDVFEQFETVMDARQTRSETIDMTFIGIDRAIISDARLEGSLAHVTLRFKSQLISATRDKDGRVIEGDPEAVTDVNDIWTFSRDLASPNPNWELVTTSAR
jgi:predicted lipid-binding transport protein (Tim44 family)